MLDMVLVLSLRHVTVEKCTDVRHDLAPVGSSVQACAPALGERKECRCHGSSATLVLLRQGEKDRGRQRLPDRGRDWWQLRLGLRAHDRKKVEDGICVRRLFAVFDGHAGKPAVLAAQSLLPETLAASLKANPDVKACLQLEEVDTRICQVLLDNQDAGTDEISSGTVVCLALAEGKDQ